jgi:hypothetical protein
MRTGLPKSCPFIPNSRDLVKSLFIPIWSRGGERRRTGMFSEERWFGRGLLIKSTDFLGKRGRARLSQIVDLEPVAAECAVGLLKLCATGEHADRGVEESGCQDLPADTADVVPAYGE